MICALHFWLVADVAVLNIATLQAFLVWAAILRQLVRVVALLEHVVVVEALERKCFLVSCLELCGNVYRQRWEFSPQLPWHRPQRLMLRPEFDIVLGCDDVKIRVLYRLGHGRQRWRPEDCRDGRCATILGRQLAFVHESVKLLRVAGLGEKLLLDLFRVHECLQEADGDGLEPSRINDDRFELCAHEITANFFVCSTKHFDW